MKKNHIIIAVLLLSVAFTACKKGLNTYEGTAGIYFRLATLQFSNNPGRDSTAISFSYAKAAVKDSLIAIPVQISGARSPEEREFKLTIDPKTRAIAGTHYEILNQRFVIPANGTEQYIFINVHRTTDMLSNNFLLVLNLEENEHFGTPMKDRLVNATTGKRLSFIKHTIWMNDILKKPAAWLDAYLGPFSRKKLFLLAEVAEIPNIGDLDNTGLTSIGKVQYYGTFLQRYLNDMRASGKTVYEDDGKEMVMGPSVQ
ncbi:DUF4843 domain-containing protein [Pedobacter gandavensis]|uniref:DUF4843 domain-containing protein n=1 Tax=Pedobacter gandavensis TaxID=2679963 RepID=UPI00247A0413|nr:DUF4843 domain-containing protein [Pedobacter gandavensis]WGQ10076.1 DUF4843 domain-containing protein [Pedobacter gandavensis]